MLPRTRSLLLRALRGRLQPLVKTALTTFIAVGVTAFAPSTFGQQPTKVYGSSTPYKQEDYDRMLKMEYNTKSLEGYSHEFETKAIEMKAAKLPEYQGKLNSIPLTEWRSPQADFYTKSLSLREFEMKQAVDLWSKPAMYSADPAIPLKASPLDAKDSDVASKEVETRDIPTGEGLSGEQLIKLINKGREVPTIKVGDKEIRGTDKVSGQSETTSPRK